MSQSPDVWKPLPSPNRRDEDKRKAEREALNSKPRPYGKPGFSIDKDGKISYDPAGDPGGKAYK